MSSAPLVRQASPCILGGRRKLMIFPLLPPDQRQKHYYDKRHMLAEIAIGSNVLLATTNLHLKTFSTRKLIPRWVGPFKVTARVGAMSYCLDLPACMHQIHNVFPISLIKQYRGDGRTQPPHLLSLWKTTLSGLWNRFWTTGQSSVATSVSLNT